MKLLPLWLSGKESTGNAGATGDLGSIPGSRRSPGEKHGNPLYYSCLENPVDKGVWRATVHRSAWSQTWLRDLACTHAWLCTSFSFEQMYITPIWEVFSPFSKISSDLSGFPWHYNKFYVFFMYLWSTCYVPGTVSSRLTFSRVRTVLPSLV